MDVTEKYSSVFGDLQEIVQSSPKLVILGIGENRMGDDGLGQKITFELDKWSKYSQIRIINGGITPEERLDELIEFQPEVLIIVDAIGGGKLNPGMVNIYLGDKILNYLPVSSHSLPLPVYIDRCYRGVPNLKIFLLGITPFSLDFMDTYELFDEEHYSLDDKEANANIPFYTFNLTPEIEEISMEIVALLKEIITKKYTEEKQ